MAQIGVPGEEHIDVRAAVDVERARRAVRVLAGSLGFSRVEQEMVTLSVSELATNLVRYAVVWRKQFGFGLFRSRKSQIQSISRELHAMRLLECDQRYFHRPTNLVLNLEG